MQDGQVDVLAVFAHPDDLELLVGGTLLKMKSLGYRAGAVDVTRGEMGTRGTPEIRAEEAAKAAKILGLDMRENLELPDGHVFCDDDSRRKMVRAFRRFRPKVILTHQLDDPGIVPKDKNGAIKLEDEPKGKKMGVVTAGPGHMTLLPVGAAYQFHADKPAVVTIQTIKGDVTIERWAEICQTE